ncbi:hypothetical protein [Nocardia arthritidis]|nr:hypothetical protein [Nocardia arthritidis]
MARHRFGASVTIGLPETVPLNAVRNPWRTSPEVSPVASFP